MRQTFNHQPITTSGYTATSTYASRLVLTPIDKQLSFFDTMRKNTCKSTTTRPFNEFEPAPQCALSPAGFELRALRLHLVSILPTPAASSMVVDILS